MQATPGPGPWSGVWNSWDAVERRQRGPRRRLALTLHDLRDLHHLKLDWTRLARPEITVYTPKQFRQLLRSFIARFDSPLGHPGQTVYPTIPTAWLPNRYQPDSPPVWRLPPDISPPRGGLGPAVPVTVQTGWWESAARGWAAGAVFLALLMLLLRAAHKCIDRAYLKRSRLSSREVVSVVDEDRDEWISTRIVSGCSTQFRVPHDLEIPSETNRDSDLPPPYSECAGSANIQPNKPVNREEPPPPYSACQVAFTNPKDGIPSVHFRIPTFEDRRQTSSAEVNQENELKTENESCEASDIRDDNELVFDNGRVVERASVVANSENEASVSLSNINIKEIEYAPQCV